MPFAAWEGSWQFVSRKRNFVCIPEIFRAQPIIMPEFMSFVE